MRPTNSKNNERSAQIRADLQAFLASGKQIQQIPAGHGEYKEQSMKERNARGTLRGVPGKGRR